MGTSGLHKGPRECRLRLVADRYSVLIPYAVAEWEARTATQSVLPLIAIGDPKEHLRRRKPWNRALNVASLKDFEPFVAHRAEQLVSRLASQKETTNLARWFGWFTYVQQIEVTGLWHADETA